VTRDVDFIQKPLKPVILKARVDLHLKLTQSMQDLKKVLSLVKKFSHSFRKEFTEN